MATHPGKVSAIHAHHGSAKHATIEVTHGKQKRSKGPGGEPGELRSYDQPRSSVVVPKAHAKQFTMGQKVNVGITPASNDGSDQDEDDAPVPQQAPPKRAGPIFQAMTRKGSSKGKRA